jgi:hypothetical protein
MNKELEFRKVHRELLNKIKKEKLWKSKKL